MASLAAVTRIRILLIVVVTIAGLAVLLWARGRRADVAKIGPVVGVPSTSSPPARTSPDPASPDPATTTPHQTQDSPNAANTPAVSFAGTLNLIVPVVGVKPEQLLDTFTDARSEGRAHDAIDIPAPAGTAVLAAADGEIVRLFQSERGGIAIYQLSADRKFVLFYAHLQGYAEGLVAGRFAKQGEVIGYVGDTGNAGAGNFHLHFSIAIVADPNRYWEGANINPYPLLRK